MLGLDIHKCIVGKTVGTVQSQIIINLSFGTDSSNILSENAPDLEQSPLLAAPLLQRGQQVAPHLIWQFYSQCPLLTQPQRESVSPAVEVANSHIVGIGKCDCQVLVGALKAAGSVCQL